MDVEIQEKKFDWLNILLIDDSVAILNYVSEVLQKNYNISNVHASSSAAEGMQILRQSKQINLLFLDLNMPNMDGIQLLEQLNLLDYKGYVVIMSGVSTQIISSVEILAKQYELNYIGTLLKPIHELDFDSIFDKVGLSRAQNKQAESLKDYEIIRAIKNDDIEVLYQPQVCLVNRKLMGVEALCRMKHPRLGMVSPDRFIDKAEESELIVHITLAVLKKSLSDWKRWSLHGLDMKLSVNISPVALQQEEFADTIFMLLTQFSMPPSKLCLEITEGVLASNQTQELVNLNRLSMRGVELALDDFGQSHSTIERLQKLPLTYLKLDKSYFIDNKDNLNQIALINASVSIAKKLGFCTIAEGVEDNSIMSLVTEMGCDFAQGYYIARPLKASKIIAWHREWQALT